MSRSTWMRNQDMRTGDGLNQAPYNNGNQNRPLKKVVR